MNLITFGTDEHMLDKNSRQHKRLLSYAALVDNYTAIVFCSTKELQIEYIGNLQLVAVPKKNKIISLYQVFKYLKKEKAGRRPGTVISTQDVFEVGVIGYIFSKLLRMPLHVQIHTAIQSPYFQKESIRNKMQYLISKFIIGRAKSFRVVSQSIKNFLLQRGISADNVFVSPIVGETSVIAKESAYISTDPYNILCVARFVDCKNLVALIEGFAMFKEKHDSTLTIIGGGVLRTTLMKKIAELGIENSTRILGWLQDLDEEYVKADLYIQPSWYEGFGSAVIEAMTRGLPAIVTPGLGVTDYIKQGINGYILKGYTAVDIAEGIEYAHMNLVDIQPADIRASLHVPTEVEKTSTLLQSWERALIKTT